jgi:3-hydroxybutyryl-CoA dehydrogenase
MLAEIRQVGVLGAGTMENGIAQVFATAGYPVTMHDLNRQFLQRGLATITKSLDRLMARGKLTDENRDGTLARIPPTTEMNDLAQCDIVVEAISENFDLKARVIQAASRNPERVIGMHFFNPVPMMELVEVIRADAVCDTVVKLVD